MTNIDQSRELHSGKYVERYVRKPLTRIERLVPLMELTPADVVADFGCGDGMLAQLVDARVAAYHGVDFSQDFIDAAGVRARVAGLANSHFHCADIIEFCQSNRAAFDVAAALDFSEHIDDATFVSTFSAIREALKPGGRLFLHTPNLGFFMERAKAAGIIPQFPEHIAVRTLEQNAALLEACGFAPDKISGRVLPHYNILRIVHPLRRLPGVGPLFEARLFITCRA